MRFAPSVGQLRCDACGALKDPVDGDEGLDAPRDELDYEAHLRDQLGREPLLEAQSVTCTQCGAATAFDPHVVASVCAFCATPLAQEPPRSVRRLRPRGVVPFRLDPPDAQQVFKRWLSGRWLMPNAVKRQVQKVDGLKGVYVPCWTYDARTHVAYAGQRGVDRTTTTRNARGDTERQTTTDWSPRQGEFDLAFDDLLVPASSSVPDHLAGALVDWDIAALAPFDGDRVAGFTVEAYQVGLEAGFARAKVMVDERVDAEVRRAIGGDRQIVRQVDVAYDAVTFKHLLLPLWISSYTHGGKVWRVVINGQTGAVAGDRPYSAWKVGSLVVVALVLLLLLMQASNA